MTPREVRALTVAEYAAFRATLKEVKKSRG